MALPPQILSPAQQDQVARTVFVGGLTPIITDKVIQAFFEQVCGPGSVSQVCMAGQPGNLFSFVEFSSLQAAQASYNISGTILGEQAIKVGPAKGPILKGSVFTKVVAADDPTVLKASLHQTASLMGGGSQLSTPQQFKYMVGVSTRADRSDDSDDSRRHKSGRSKHRRRSRSRSRSSKHSRSRSRSPKKHEKDDRNETKATGSASREKVDQKKESANTSEKNNTDRSSDHQQKDQRDRKRSRSRSRSKTRHRDCRENRDRGSRSQYDDGDRVPDQNVLQPSAPWGWSSHWTRGIGSDGSTMRGSHSGRSHWTPEWQATDWRDSARRNRYSPPRGNSDRETWRAYHQPFRNGGDSEQHGTKW